MTTLNAAEVLAENARRLEWVMRFQRLLPTIARIGEEMQAPRPSIATLECLGWGDAQVYAARFAVTLLVGNFSFAQQLAPDADEVAIEATIRAFFAALIKECGDA